MVNGKLFGTSGIRGIADKELTDDFMLDVSRSIGTYLGSDTKVCIATDTRLSREKIKRILTSGLYSSGIEVTDLGILPTPALAFLTNYMGFDTGIMVTASHNPPEYNGLKLFNGNSFGYSQQQQEDIENIYYSKNFLSTNSGQLSELENAREIYFQQIMKRFPHNIDYPKIVVDAGNGAASGFASELFSRMGLDVVAINDEPNGRFPGRNPEPREDTLQSTIEFLRREGADIAVCFDGDADRVVFCDERGFLGLDEMMSFISRLEVLKSGNSRIATTVETGKLIELALNHLDVEVMRGKVGDVCVAYLAYESKAALGVEPSGVYIMPEIGYYPDSIYAVLSLLNHLSDSSEIRIFYDSLPRLFGFNKKIPCPNHLKQQAMQTMKEYTPRFQPNDINTLDGLRLEFEDSWLLVRASGTEPIIRISGESVSERKMKSLIKRSETILLEILWKLQ